MDAERLRAFLLKLPDVVETVQWGDNLVFWVGDKAIGGKMFAVLDLDKPVAHRRPAVIAYAAGPERYPELLEIEGIFPAPYAARNHWVAAEHWRVFRDREWEEQLWAGHAVILAKLAPRTRAVLAMPAAQRKRLIVERRKVLAERAGKRK